LQRDATAIVAILIGLAASVLSYASLPTFVPVHWNITGQIDKELPRELAAWLYPAAMALVYVFFRLIPFADRNRVRQLREIGVYDLLRTGAVLLFGYGHALVLGIGLGWASRQANFLVGAAAILIALWADHAEHTRPEWLRRVLERRAPSMRQHDLTRGIKLACAVAVLGTFTGKWQPAWLLVPLAAAVGGAALRAARRRP
jgi:hypothetical protein